MMGDCNHFAYVISLVESKLRIPIAAVRWGYAVRSARAECFRLGEIAKGNAGMRERKLYDRTL